MSNSKIVITAGLDRIESTNTIVEDLKEIEPKLDGALKIICHIDDKSIDVLKSELQGLSSRLKIEVPQIAINSNSDANKTINEITDKSNKANEAIKKINNSLKNLDNSYIQSFERISGWYNGNLFTDAEANIQALHDKLKSLGEVSVRGVYSSKDSRDLKGMIATIKNAQGELRTLKFELKGKDFVYKSGTYDDKGVAKYRAEISKLTSEFENLKSKYSAISTGLTQPFEATQKAFDNLSNGTGSLENVRAALSNINAEANKIGTNLGSKDKSFNVFENAVNNARNFDNVLKSIEIDVNALGNLDNKNALVGQLDTAKKELLELQRLQESAGTNEQWSKQYDVVNSLIKDINNNLKVTRKIESQAEDRISLSNRISKSSAALEDWGNKNRKAITSTKQMSDSMMTYAQKWGELTSRMSEFEDKIKNGTLTDGDIDNFRHLNEEINTFKKRCDAANLTTSSFFRSMRIQLSYVLMQWISLQGAIRTVKSLVDEVRTLDTAMVELRKVTEATDEEFSAFQESAGKTARTLGASISDVINATSTFSRAGFTLPEAEELGRVATLYKNVGDGIDIEGASESIISIIKAFNIEATEAERIIDRINKVSNNFAIDSGGLGLALQRVASAMDAANNTLDETIALTTVSNEVVQNPEMVAQGWRTVALRIRGAKSELEEAGEDTEGMLESTAKLRDLIKGISGVDIMIDENNFKSTYQIIEELGKVWDDISDINQASLLEAIAGKRQSNIVAAALNNYERLNDVLTTSVDSFGSAQAEQEEYAKSIQYSFDTLKAAFQDFAQHAINNNSVKNILAIAQSALEALTKIVDKLGTIPTLLSAIYAIRYMKTKKGFFGTMIDEADGATKRVTILGKEVSKIKSDFQNSNTSGLTKIGAALDGIKLKAIAAEIATTALNAAISFGISLAINAAVTGITKWINKEKEAAEQAEKLRQEMEERRKATVENIKVYENETENINSLIGQYIKLISTTNDISSINDDLSKIQDQIIEKYGLEADAIDLVNGKLEENIQLLLEQEQQRNKDWLRENAEGIEDAEDFFNQEHNAYDLLSFHGEEGSLKKSFGAARIEASKYFEYLKEEFKKAGISDLIQENFGFSQDSFTYGFTLKEGLAPEQQLNTIKKVIESYEKMNEEMSTRGFTEYFNLQGEDYNNLINTLKQYSDYLSIVQTKQQKLSETESLDSLLSTDDLETYKNKIKQFTTLYQTFNDATQTPTKRYSAFIESEEIKRDIQDLIYLYPALKDQAEATMQSLGTTSSTVMANEEILFKSFVETLDNTHKTALDNIEKLETAMASAIKGEGLSNDSAWELLKLDTDKLLKPMVDAAGQYHFELNDIVALKDQIINKNKELIEQDVVRAKQEKEQIDNELKLAQLQFNRINVLIRQQAIGSNRPNESLVKEQMQLREQIESLTKSSKAYGDEIERNNILLQEYNAHSGNLLNTEKMLQAQIDALKQSQDKLKGDIDDLNSQADKLLKAQETKIDNIVEGLEAEADELEKSKQLLEEQLDILNEQKEELEAIVENYESVADIVDSTISKQIDELEQNRKAIEEYYDNLIDKLKEENEERSDALDYAQKLAALENAKNNKVRVYGSGTGWTYMADQDALAEAQKALEEADVDKAVKELEKEKESAISNYDIQIKAYQDYANEWKEVTDEIRTEEDALLAEQILGSDWREKISEKDIKILRTYRTEYRNYTTQIKSLTDNEIKALKASIDAKSDEVKAKKEQIQVWKDYKAEVENAVKAAKNSLEGYNELLNKITLDENSTYEQRQKNLSNFANKYSDILSQINQKNSALDNATNKISELNRQITELSNNPINIQTDVSEAADTMADFIDKYREAVDLMRKRLDESITGYGTVNSQWDAQLAQAANELRKSKGFSEGGAVDYTGFAKVHGSPLKSETTFSAAQSRELWNMVRTGSFANLVAEKALDGISHNLRNYVSETSNTNNKTIVIQEMVIKSDNPKQFHTQFMSEIKQYWDVQLSESPIQ